MGVGSDLDACAAAAGGPLRLTRLLSLQRRNAHGSGQTGTHQASTRQSETTKRQRQREARGTECMNARTNTAAAETHEATIETEQGGVGSARAAAAPVPPAAAPSAHPRRRRGCGRPSGRRPLAPPADAPPSLRTAAGAVRGSPTTRILVGRMFTQEPARMQTFTGEQEPKPSSF